MNKADLIDRVQAELGPECSKSYAEKAVNTVLSAIGHGLQSDEVVQLIGFGTFQVRERKERTGRNPQTKQPMIIPASKSVGFKPGAKLKESITTA